MFAQCGTYHFNRICKTLQFLISLSYIFHQTFVRNGVDQALHTREMGEKRDVITIRSTFSDIFKLNICWCITSLCKALKSFMATFNIIRLILDVTEKSTNNDHFNYNSDQGYWRTLRRRKMDLDRSSTFVEAGCEQQMNRWKQRNAIKTYQLMINKSTRFKLIAWNEDVWRNWHLFPTNQNIKRMRTCAHV